jgi:probable F420-dependent oxidoreductase
MRPFRFAYQTLESSASDLRAAALNAEQAGFDVFQTLDHFGGYWAPFTPLGAIAGWTKRIRLCPLVINNDFHHPMNVAREIVSLDRVSDGRAEVGLGAGHAFTEYTSIGLQFDIPAVRKARLRESVEILQKALTGKQFSYEGASYRIEDAYSMRPVQERIPILVGVNGSSALAHAARTADIVGLTMFGRTLSNGQAHEMRWQPDRLDRTIAWIRKNSASRPRPPELHALVHRVEITSDRKGYAEEVAGRFAGLSPEDAISTPFLAFGSHDEIAAQLVSHRERWGISYYTVRDIDNFYPVIDRLRSIDD